MSVRRVDSAVEWEEDKRRKPKARAAERERQVEMRREMKRRGLVEGERDGEWVLKERRDLV